MHHVHTTPHSHNAHHSWSHCCSADAAHTGRDPSLPTSTPEVAISLGHGGVDNSSRPDWEIFRAACGLDAFVALSLPVGREAAHVVASSLLLDTGTVQRTRD
jgi:hypothetical protein